MLKRWLNLIIPSLLVLALAACFGGGGTNDNPAAGVEPASDQVQQDSSELLVNDGFVLPTENATEDASILDLDVTSTAEVDAAILGNDGSDDALFGGSDAGALDGGSSTTAIVPDSTATIAP